VSRTGVAGQWTLVGPIAALFSDVDHPPARIDQIF
jgi:hypothetical protein